MKTFIDQLPLPAVVILLLLANAQAAAPNSDRSTNPATPAQPVPWSSIGATAEAGYNGDGLTLTPTSKGARLHCSFQRLEAEATDEGLWLRSTATNAPDRPVQVKAAALGRRNINKNQLPTCGRLTVSGKLVSYVRPGLTEEYSVTIDGIRQDFLIADKPPGTGELTLELNTVGARVEPAQYGAVIVLQPSGRKIAYGRLRVTDATGRELPARIQALPTFQPNAPNAIAISLNDQDAEYPLRIGPTFSDANWVSLNASIPGAGGIVYAAVVDASGNLYIGGAFTQVGATNANYIAKWDGSNWSPLASGMNDVVYTLVLSGTTLYAGGDFTTAGSGTANHIAKWDGTNWSSLDNGVNSTVRAIAISGSDLYAGGDFTTAGGSSAKYVAKWNPNRTPHWAALGSGLNNTVYALAAYGTDLYVGGSFTTAGSSQAFYLV